MNYRIIPVTTFIQNCSLIWCEKTKLAALIDPGGDPRKIKKEIEINNVRLIYVLLTHGHLDHVGAAGYLAKYYDIPIVGPGKEDIFWLQNISIQSRVLGLDECKPFVPDNWLVDGENINIGNIHLQVIHCPGHTPGHIVFFDSKSRLLISGDVLFKGSIGCSNFPYSNHRKLVRSIKQKLLPLGDDITFIAGHGSKSTLGYERQYNPFLIR